MIRTGLILVCLVEAAAAQTGDSGIQQARKAFDDCVYGSIAAQLGQTAVPKQADISLLAEQGFAACATEERILGTLVGLTSADTRAVDIALLGIRAQIKRQVQAIAANPAAYAQPAPRPKFNR